MDFIDWRRTTAVPQSYASFDDYDELYLIG